MAENSEADVRRSRLLRHLAEPGAFALASPLGCGRIALYRANGGTSLGAGYVLAQEAEAAVAAGLARWDGTGKARRLTLAAAAPASKRALSTRTMLVDGVVQPVLVDDRESPLLWLHRRAGKDGRPQISAAEFAAGERFRADLTLAQMLPRTTMNWDAAFAPEERGSGRDPGSASDSALAARQRIGKACDKLGPELSGLAIDVCGFLKGLDQVERERGWPARSAKVVLRLALSALASHYGIDVAPRSSKRSGSVWRADDARPQIMPGA
ncbi:ATPase [Bosea caraganae]|uniref:ATPase n=1 Tax=Bosea caraganae TaxID=2763117 RepID=A0A370L3U8_9HYPH|nr:DUF6456 domain-containing protein [Bosea caraganae]RDJ23550.1 ATPase [Bosea caraganae]RDJ24366.1 ATPase [Bosea caraganae]